jgi:glycosyltransferase involved in cell wall biosynthesis
MTSSHLNLPKVSVMVVAYNQAHFLGETLESIRSQDYPNIEIVVSDDASTDGSQDLLREYARLDPGRFNLVLNEKNLGITGNHNSALAACSGDLVAILAGDDLFLPGKIAAQAKQFVDDPEVVLSYHPVEIFDSATGRTLFVTNQLERENTNSVEEIISHAGIPGVSSIMFRRSAAPEGGYDSSVPIASDWLFCIEIAAKGKVTKLDGVYGRYRKHDNNIGRKLDSYFHELVATMDIVAKKFPDRPSIQAACQRGRARQLAGEAFRQMAVDHRRSQELFRTCLRLAPHDLRYRLGYAAARFPVTRAIALRSKYLLKRYFG